METHVESGQGNIDEIEFMSARVTALIPSTFN